MATAAFVGDYDQPDTIVAVGKTQEIRITNSDPDATIEYEEAHKGDHTMYVVAGVIYVDVKDEEGVYEVGKGGIINVAGGLAHTITTRDKPATVMHVFSLHHKLLGGSKSEVKHSSKRISKEDSSMPSESTKSLSKVRSGTKAT